MQRNRTIQATLFGLVALTLLLAPGALAGDGVVVEKGPVTFLGVGTARADDGVRVTQVVSGSAAEAVGLRRGDRIVEFAGRPVATPQELATLVRAQAAGDLVEVTVARDGNRVLLSTELGQRSVGTRLRLDGEYWVWSPHMRGRVQGEIGLDRHNRTQLEDIYLCPADENCVFSNASIWYRADCVGSGCTTYAVRYHGKPMLGVEAGRTTPERTRDRGGETDGVLVGKVTAGSPAEVAGILVGDRIVAVDGKPTQRFETLRQAIRNVTGGVLDVEVERDGRTRNLRAWIEEPGPAGPIR